MPGRIRQLQASEAEGFRRRWRKMTEAQKGEWKQTRFLRDTVWHAKDREPLKRVVRGYKMTTWRRHSKFPYAFNRYGKTYAEYAREFEQSIDRKVLRRLLKYKKSSPKKVKKQVQPLSPELSHSSDFEESSESRQSSEASESADTRESVESRHSSESIGSKESGVTRDSSESSDSSESRDSSESSRESSRTSTVRATDAEG